jgi:hypothetical protein
VGRGLGFTSSLGRRGAPGRARARNAGRRGRDPIPGRSSSSRRCPRRSPTARRPGSRRSPPGPAPRRPGRWARSGGGRGASLPHEQVGRDQRLPSRNALLADHEGARAEDVGGGRPAADGRGVAGEDGAPARHDLRAAAERVPAGMHAGDRGGARPERLEGVQVPGGKRGVEGAVGVEDLDLFRRHERSRRPALPPGRVYGGGHPSYRPAAPTSRRKPGWTGPGYALMKARRRSLLLILRLAEDCSALLVGSFPGLEVQLRRAVEAADIPAQPP